MVDKTAFLFAGQGSQYVGMGKDLYEAFPESRQVFDEADHELGFSLAKLCFEGPSEELKKTAVSQPAIVTVTMAAFEAFKKHKDIEPAFAAGLSLGEYSALIAMGAFTFKDGIKLVQRRGQLMDAAARKFPGKMAAVIDLPVDTIKDICRKTEAAIANLNCPGQTIISGFIAAVDKAKEECLKAGAKRVIDLEVSGGFHSPLMFEASGELKALLEDTRMSVPHCKIIGNFNAQPELKPAQIRQNLVYQLYSSVRWEESMRFLISQGITGYYEFGPGKVLRGLMRKIDPAARVTPVEKKDDILGLITEREA